MPNLPMNWKYRYQQAHELHFRRNTPQAYQDGFYCNPKFPDILKANGLTLAIVNHLNWSGHRAKSINVMGRKVDRVVTEKTSGNKFKESHYIKASNRATRIFPQQLKAGR
jgi:hypothetical protein